MNPRTVTGTIVAGGVALQGGHSLSSACLPAPRLSEQTSRSKPAVEINDSPSECPTGRGGSASPAAAVETSWSFVRRATQSTDWVWKGRCLAVESNWIAAHHTPSSETRPRHPAIRLNPE